MSKWLLVCIISILFFINGFSQVVGSHDNSDMIPSEVKASKLETGMLSGDVNLFSGDYQTSVNLGSVSTPGGLSFSLNLNYSSTYVAGTSPTVAAGIPYGEGWDLGIPTVSVSNAAYFSFTQYQEYFKANNATGPTGTLPDGLDTNYFDQTTGAQNGDIYWYSPTVSIPGYASGKAIFKHLENNGSIAVFILNKFEKYVELRFDGSTWEVALDNGLIYEMGAAMVSFRAPNNQRVLNYNTESVLVNNGVDEVNTNDYTFEKEMVKNSIEPKQEITTWYCSEIRSKNIEFQLISFEYEKFGGFNFFKEYEQPVIANQIGSKLMVTTDPTPGGFNGDFHVYRDILLSKITSRSISTVIEVLDLSYKSAQLNGTGLIGANMLDFSDPNDNVQRKDSLYSYKVIYEQGLTGNFGTEWNRYSHGKADLVSNLNYAISSINPYLANGNTYVREVGEGGSNSLPFSHGFLETKRFTSSEMVSGDIYEIRTKVIDNNGSSNVQGNGTIDISVVTGGCGISTDGQGGLVVAGSYNSLNNSSGLSYPAAAYTKTRGEQVYSTFGNAIKWQISSATNNIHTSNYFVMPNIPTTNGGVNVQIGPGGSDNNYAKSAGVGSFYAVGLDANTPSAFNSYAHRSPQFMSSYSNVPANFGIGLPWSMTLPLYASGMGGYNETNGVRMPFKSSFANFWWNDSDIYTAPNWSNIPTKFDEDVYLKEFELIRYSKNPYMLSSVKTYKLNGEISAQSDSGLVLVNQKDLKYNIDFQNMYENYDYMKISKSDTLAASTANHKIISNVSLYPQVSPQVQYVYTLTNLKDVPTGHYADSVHIAATTTNYIETDLDYDWFGGDVKKGWTSNTFVANSITYDITDSIRLNPGRKSKLLTTITNPLGGEDLIEYYPSNSATTWHSTAGNNKPNSTGGYFKRSYASSKATVIHPSVKSIIRNKDIVSPAAITINNTLESKTDYYYDTTKIIWETEDINIPENFRNAYQFDYQKGFQKVTTVNSELATGERNYSISYFGGNVNTHIYNPVTEQSILNPSTVEEYLLFGKLIKTENYNSQNLLESSVELTYDYTLAHKNAIERPSIYRNDLTNPHADFERYSGTSAGYHDYEYGDYYRGDVFQTNEVITGCISNNISGNQEGAGYMTPYFYNDLITTNDERSFRSYFVKLTSKSKKDYDQSCKKATSLPPVTVYQEYSVESNPFGGEPANPKPNNNIEYIALTKLIAENTTGGIDLVDTLVSMSPLSDSLLEYIINTTELLSNDVIYDVLIQQNPLNNSFLTKIYDNSNNLLPSQILGVYSNQPYLTDIVQEHVINNFESHNNSTVTNILNHNAYLSDHVLEVLFNQEGLPEIIVNDVVVHQPQLNVTNISNLISASSEVEAFNIVDIISSQDYIPESIFSQVLLSSSLSDKDKADILIQSISYPTDEEIIKDFLDLNITNQDYLDIVTKSPYIFSVELKGRIESRLSANELSLFQTAQAGLLGYEKYCINPTICSNDYIETKEDYTYFEADYMGHTLENGYKKLLGLEDVVGKVVSGSDMNLSSNITLQTIKLKHEPSWQVHSIKSYSPDYPGAFSQQEYYYYFDELNRQDRHIQYYDVAESAINWQLDTSTTYDTIIYLYENSGDFISNEILYGQVPLSDGGRCSQRNFLRNIPFQQTTVSKNITDEDALSKSFYYLYDTKIHVGGKHHNSITKFFNGPNCDSLTNAINCENNIIDYATHAYAVTDAETLGDLPLGYCAYEVGVYGGPVYFIKAGFDFSNCAQMQHDSIRLIGCNDGTGGSSGGSQGFVHIAAQYQGQQISLVNVIAQIDTVPKVGTDWDIRLDKSNSDIAFFIVKGQDANGLWEDEMIFPFDTLSIRTIDSLNHYGQVALEHNQSGIYTKYNYDLPVRIWHKNSNATGYCIGIGNYASYIATNIGKPTSIVVGFNRLDSLRSTYEYYPNYRTKALKNPNNIVSSYTYDDYGRLHEAYSNGRLLGTNNYHYWDRNVSDDYEARTQKNYVESYVYNDTITVPNSYNGIHTKSYTDIYGRDIQSISAINADQDAVISPTVEYDNWSRPVRTFKPKSDFSGTLNLQFSPFGFYEKALFENNTKSRLKRKAAFGINQIQSFHTVKQSHQIVNDIVLACDLRLRANEIEMLLAGDLSTTAKFYKSTIEDEDGKTLTTYTNPIGQKIATLQYGTEYGTDINDEIITLFGYDSYGNLTAVINPEKQISTYDYNILGQLYKQNTVDAGETKYMYNKQGNIVLKQTANNKVGKLFDNTVVPYFTKYEYDDYGRLLKQRLASKSMHVMPTNEHNYPLFDYLNYADSSAGLSGNGGFTYVNGAADQDYFEYKFSNRSTYWWLADVKVVLPLGGQGGHQNIEVKVNSLIFDQYLEKSFRYGHDNVGNALGKNNRIVNYDKEGRIIQVIDLEYNIDGNLLSETTEFNPSGKLLLTAQYSTPSITVSSKMVYSDYDYHNKAREVSVDIGNDDATDFQYHYDFSEWGQLERVYFNFGDNPQNKTDVTLYLYEPTTGQNTQVKHLFAPICPGQTSNINVDESQFIIKNYDERNRLISQKSELLKYSLYYDNQTPSGIHGQSINSSQNWNGNINGISVRYTDSTNLSLNNTSAQGWQTDFAQQTVYGYKYDLLNRLVSADASQGAIILNSGLNSQAYKVGDAYYQFDKVGNFTSLQREVLLPTTNNTYAYATDEWAYNYLPNTNKLLLASGSNINTQSRQYTYDSNGNLLSDNLRDISGVDYYRDNFPVQINKPNETIHYLYGADDIRNYKKVIDASTNQPTTEEYYLKNIGIYDMVNNEWTYYVNGLGREAKIKPKDSQIPAAIFVAGSLGPEVAKDFDISFYLTDYLGNTRIVYKPSIVGCTNTIRTTNTYMADYYPYGKILREYVPIGREKFLTTQHERDDETGLDYRGARFYDSDVGRFLSLDPLATKFPSWSPYNYVFGNPIKYTDPNGKEPISSEDDGPGERKYRISQKMSKLRAKQKSGTRRYGRLQNRLDKLNDGNGKGSSYLANHRHSDGTPSNSKSGSKGTPVEKTIVGAAPPTNRYGYKAATVSSGNLSIVQIGQPQIGTSQPAWNPTFVANNPGLNITANTTVQMTADGRNVLDNTGSIITSLSLPSSINSLDGLYSAGETIMVGTRSGSPVTQDEVVRTKLVQPMNGPTSFESQIITPQVVNN